MHGNTTIKLELGCRHRQPNRWFDLHTREECLHRQYVVQQDRRIYIHVQEQLFANSMTHIVTQKQSF